MKLTKDNAKQGISWGVELTTSQDTGEITDPVKGELEVQILNDVVYPTQVEIEVTECDYIEVDEDIKTIESAESPVATYQIILSENTSEEWGRNKISYADSAGNRSSTFFPLKSAEIVNLCAKILSPESDSEEIIGEISYLYAGDSSPLAYSKFRDHARHCTNFDEYMEILGFLYAHSDTKHDVKEDLINFFKKRVASGEYQAGSTQELEERIEIIGKIRGLTDISQAEGIHEVYAIHHEKMAEVAAESKNFQQSNHHIEQAIEYYEKDEKSEVSKPIILKQHAVNGILAESNSDFETASTHYENAARDADDPHDIRIYEVWQQLTEAKNQLSKGNLDLGRELIDEIPEGFEEISLVELRKLSILASLIEDYERDSESHAQTVYNHANIPYISQESVIQYNADYSAAYSMLLARQRLKKLDKKSDITDELLMSIRDAIIPGGIEGNENVGTESNSVSKPANAGNRDSTGESVTKVEHGYIETQRARRDPRFSDDVVSEYDGTCAICGSQRQSPDGKPEVEAAHIRPVKDDGPHTVNNGVALCQLHHWAFDKGWIAIRDDYTIKVRDAPDITGYEDFVELEGKSIRLPDNTNSHPNPEFLRHHRSMFELDS